MQRRGQREEPPTVSPLRVRIGVDGVILGGESCGGTAGLAVRRTGHKYNAQRTTLDGYTFASKAEAKRYAELKLLEKAGEISELELQPKFPLFVRTPDMKFVKVCVYKADFRYRLLSDGWPGNGRVTEDVKGVRTETYKLKKKMVEAQYGIQITEITR